MIEMTPALTADACVIWLHGLGADGSDFVPVVEAMDLPAVHSIRFLFPDAPVQPVSINGGMPMPAWFDISQISEDMDEDVIGIRQSGERIAAIIDQQVESGIPASRIVLGGFSQGGCIALQTGLRYRQALGGIIGLSCFLPLQDAIQEEWQSCQLQTPLMLMHGLDDNVVPYQMGRNSYELLLGMGMKISWYEYPMQHSLCQKQLQDIRAFLVGRLINAPASAI